MSETMSYTTETVTLLSPAEMASGIAEHIFEFGAGGAVPQRSYFVLEDPIHRAVWEEVAAIFGFSADLSKPCQIAPLSDDGHRRQLIQQLEGEASNIHGVWLVCQESNEGA